MTRAKTRPRTRKSARPVREGRSRHHVFGIEGQDGDVLREPEPLAKKVARERAQRLADQSGVSVFLFQVGRELDGVRIVVDREEFFPEGGEGEGESVEAHRGHGGSCGLAVCTAAHERDLSERATRGLTPSEIERDVTRVSGARGRTSRARGR